MLTSTAPILAVANWISVHSGQFGAQIPTRSPFPIPRFSNPTATASTSRLSSAYVHRRPEGRSTRASRSPWAATVRSKLSPIVSPSIGASHTPLV